MKNPFERSASGPEAEPRAPLRRGGPEETAAGKEESEKSIEQAKREGKEDQERKKAEWPEKKIGLERRKQELIAKIEKASQQIENYKAEWKKNNDRVFAAQSRTDSNNIEQVNALQELRSLANFAQRNQEVYEEEKTKLEVELSGLEGELSLGDKSFGGGV